MKLRVFVGASKESQPVVDCITTGLDKKKFAVIPWFHDEFATGSGYFLDRLLTAPEEQDFDFAIFVMGMDDLTTSRGKGYKTTRDNVLFELGIFMSKLGKDRNGHHRTFVLAPKPWKTKLKILSDFQGYTPHYYEPAKRAATKEERKKNLETVLKPVLRDIEKQMHSSGPHGSECLEQVAWVSPLLTEYFKSSLAKRVVKNLALDLGATWNIYEALLAQPDVRNITVQTLMFDGHSREIAAVSKRSGSPTARAALQNEKRVITFLKAQNRSSELAKRGIHFECRAYDRVPFVHGFLMVRHKLLLTMLRFQNGKMEGQPNPYWDFDYPKTKSTSKARTIRHSFEAYEMWFDRQWKIARPVWPVP